MSKEVTAEDLKLAFDKLNRAIDDYRHRVEGNLSTVAAENKVEWLRDKLLETLAAWREQRYGVEEEVAA